MVHINGKFTNIYYDKYNLNLYLVMVNGEISIASYNCNGLEDNKKRQSVFTWMKEKENNIYCLQETHSPILDEVVWKKDLGGKIYFSYGQRN